MMLELEMSDRGNLSYFLGMEFTSTSKGIFLHQKNYVEDGLKNFDMLNCNAAMTPIEVGAKLS